MTAGVTNDLEWVVILTDLKIWLIACRSGINKISILIWEKILKCKSEQIDLKTKLKLPNNLFYLY
jgi:hypothetical protein